MSAPFPNVYHHRKVAEASSKACDICYKPSTSVLITPDNKDFFFVCPAHLKDQYFCTPKIDHDALKAKRDKELEEEKERVKKEYEEKQKRKKEKDAKSKDDKDKDGEKDKDKAKDKDAKEDEGKDAEKDKSSDKTSDEPTQQEEPRIFELKSAFYQQRVMKKRQTEVRKVDRERMSRPGYFPSVPSGAPSR